MSNAENPIIVDIPVALQQVKSMHSIGGLAFEGDLPASLFHLQLITADIIDWGAQSEVIAVFHTNAGHVTLHDVAYDAARHIATGNPYKELVVALMNGGTIALLIGIAAGVLFSPMMGVVIALAMVINIAVAGLAGVLVPVIFERLDQDPAVASSVFVTMITDSMGFFAFLGLAVAAGLAPL